MAYHSYLSSGFRRTSRIRSVDWRVANGQKTQMILRPSPDSDRSMVFLPWDSNSGSTNWERKKRKNTLLDTIESSKRKSSVFQYSTRTREILRKPILYIYVLRHSSSSRCFFSVVIDESSSGLFSSGDMTSVGSITMVMCPLCTEKQTAFPLVQKPKSSSHITPTDRQRKETWLLFHFAWNLYDRNT